METSCCTISVNETCFSESPYQNNVTFPYPYDREFTVITGNTLTLDLIDRANIGCEKYSEYTKPHKSSKIRPTTIKVFVGFC